MCFITFKQLLHTAILGWQSFSWKYNVHKLIDEAEEWNIIQRNPIMNDSDQFSIVVKQKYLHFKKWGMRPWKKLRYFCLTYLFFGTETKKKMSPGSCFNFQTQSEFGLVVQAWGCKPGMMNSNPTLAMKASRMTLSQSFSFSSIDLTGFCYGESMKRKVCWTCLMPWVICKYNNGSN